MVSRHESIGIKQVIRYEWMEKTANLLLAGLDAKSIRQELHMYLADRRGDGTERERSPQTRAFVVSNLMRVWVSPDPELVQFRDASLVFLREDPSRALAIHWGMISVVYPFWFYVSRQVGRLLALQDQVTLAQIIARLKEQYGDRQTVSRYAQYVMRSFVAWGVLKDSEATGCYEKTAQKNVDDVHLAVLLVEAGLLATPEGKGALGLFLSNPSFFPFHLPKIVGGLILRNCARMDVLRYGLDDELVKLKDDYFNQAQ